MTDEEKQLIFKVLSAMLPYHVRVKVWLEDGDTEEGPLDLEHNYGDVLRDAFYYNRITKIKPYLRPMTSMTEEEKSWYESLRNALTYQENGEYDLDDFNELNDFLNRKKLDRYGLIEKGLALKAHADMYK